MSVKEKVKGGEIRNERKGHWEREKRPVGVVPLPEKETAEKKGMKDSDTET